MGSYMMLIINLFTNSKGHSVRFRPRVARYNILEGIYLNKLYSDPGTRVSLLPGHVVLVTNDKYVYLCMYVCWEFISNS